MSKVLNGGFINAKNRPIMVIKYIKRPAKGQNTSVKGWGETGQWDVEEDVVITTRLKTKQEIEAHVVIDILQARVIRNRFDDTNTETIYKHFMEKYNEKVQRALSTWLRENYSTDEAKAHIAEITQQSKIIDAEVVVTTN
jgi:hypothetical protein